MAVLGRQGVLRLNRTLQPVEAPYVVLPSAVNRSDSTIAISGNNFQTGSEISIAVTMAPEWEAYLPHPPITGYVYRHGTFPKISIYNTLQNALLGGTAGLISLNTGYTVNPLTPGLWVAGGVPTFSSLALSVTSGFKTQAQIVDWSLNLSNSEIDTTSLSHRFSDAIKSGVVSGGGSFNFLVERTQSTPSQEDSTALLNLLFLSDADAKPSAEFWMIRNRASTICGNLASGSLYYTADILITSSVINTTVDTIISGSVEFVTVGDIQLLITPFS